MNILIVEPEINGHHFVMYVRFLIRGLVKKNIKFSILTSTKIKKHGAYKIISKEKKNIKFYYLKDLRYPKFKNFISLFIFQITNFLKIKKSFNKINKIENFDHIFLTTLDHIDKVIPIFGSPFGKKNFSSIILNPKNHLNEYDLAKYNPKKFIYDINIQQILKLKYLQSLYSNDPLFVKYIKKKNYECSNKIFYFDEPVELKYLKKNSVLKKVFNFTQKDFVILVYGAIKNSKSVTELVEILNQKNLNNNIKVLLCGIQTKDIKEFLKKKICKNLIKQKKLKVIEKFLNLREEEIVFGASDLVWIVYKESSFGSSGVLFLAKKAKIPIISSRNGIPFWINKKYKLGPSVEIDNQESIIRVLNEMSIKGTTYKKFQRNVKLKSKTDYVRNFYVNILRNSNFFK